jgi:hypothetical protein
MAIRLRLSGDIDLTVDAAYADVQNAYQAAIRDGVLLEIRHADGEWIAVNPQQILYLQPLQDGLQSQNPQAPETAGARAGNGASLGHPG